MCNDRIKAKKSLTKQHLVITNNEMFVAQAKDEPARIMTYTATTNDGRGEKTPRVKYKPHKHTNT